MSSSAEKRAPVQADKLLASLPTAFVYSVDEKITYANEGVKRLLGYEPEALVGRSIFDFIHELDERGLQERYWARHAGEPVPSRYELALLGAQGPVQVEIEVQSLGERAQIMLLRDVGDRMRDSQLVVDLSRISVELRRARTVREVFAAAGEGVARLGLQFAVLRIHDEVVQVEHVQTNPKLIELATKFLGSGARLRLPMNSLSRLPLVLQKRSSIYFDDIGFDVRRFVERAGLLSPEQVDTLMAEWPSGKGVLSPLFVEERPWGALCFFSDSLNSGDAAALSLFAAQVGSAVEVAQAMTRLERLNRNLTAVHAVSRVGGDLELERVVPELLRVAAQATDSHAAVLYLRDPHSSDLVAGGTWNWPGGALQEPFRRVEGGSFLLRDQRAGDPLTYRADALQEPFRPVLLDLGIRDVAFVPLRLEDSLIGMLKLARTSDRPYGPQALRAADVLASQISIKIENARLYSEARRHVRLLTGLFNVSRIGAEASEVGPLISRLLEQVVEVLDVDVATIHLLREGRLQLAGQCSQPGRSVLLDSEEIEDLAIDEQSLCGRAARERRTFTAGFFRQPELFSPVTRRIGVRHAVAVPLVGSDRLIGTFWVARLDEKPFDPQEVQILESCAANASVAIENARLVETERRRVSDLSLINELGDAYSKHLAMPDVLETGAGTLPRIADASRAFLLLFDPSRQILRLAASSQPLPEGTEIVLTRGRPSAAFAAVDSLKPVRIDDVETDPRIEPELGRRFGHKTVVAVPLVSAGEAIGAMVLGDTRPGRQFSQAEVDRAVAVGNQLAAAISNARLFEAERKRVQDLRLLLDVGRVITGSLDLDEILEGSVASFAGIADASHAFIWLLDPVNRVLRGAATSMVSHREDFRSTRMALEEPSAAAEAVRSRSVVRVCDAANSSTVNQVLRARYGQKSLLAVPLLLRDEPIGSIAIGDAERVRDWSEAEIERVTVMAGQVAVAVANARLFDDLRKSYDTLARTQQELVKRERLAALGELAAVVAHEVRNPLGVIFNSIGPIRKALQPGSNGGMLLDIVSEEADRLNRIVGDLLDFARPTDPSFLLESLEALVLGACDAVRPNADAVGVRLETELVQPIPMVRADARMLRQALVNLISNGTQAMPRGGRLLIRVAEEARGSRKGAQVDITDSGPGIPPDMAERIFQPFFTTKASGTGLGLAVVKRIIERHAGEIWLDSTPGKGSTFHIWLPA